ncbi:MAG: prolyl oligopeptidase family serine peptidase, partial [Candidatus Methanomethylicia archaeon]
AITGRSNGGLLVSAIITQTPEIVDCAVIGYPVIDMLKFHKLHPGVAKLWILEYGDPENPFDREYLLKYSPYHNLKSNLKYPPTMIYTGLKDDRVHPAHALKFAAKLLSVGANVYLRLEEMSGHIGASPEVRAREESDILAFIYHFLKVYR